MPPEPLPRPTPAQLFLAFLRLGLTAFGGPAMVAYIRRLAVEKKGWLEAEQFKRGVALCQMIPGATAMQVAAYVGLRTRGVRGAAACFIGFGLPAFLLMLLFTALYAATHTLPLVVLAFSGLQAIVVALIANATLNFGRTTLKRWDQIVLALVAAALFGLNVNPLLVLLATACASLVLIRLAGGAEPPRSGTPFPLTWKPALAIFAVYGLGLLALFLFRRDLFDLSLLLFRIDLTAFGGGFASVPLMFHEIVDVRAWMDAPTLMNGIVLGQLTPGPIVITATFVGYLLAGLPGSLVATVSIFLPSFLLVVGIAPYFESLRASPWFQKVVTGVLCSFVGMLAAVTIRFALDVHWDLAHALLAAGALTALLFKVDILWVVLGGACLSLLLFL
jgi:chromate transporter